MERLGFEGSHKRLARFGGAAYQCTICDLKKEATAEHRKESYEERFTPVDAKKGQRRKFEGWQAPCSDANSACCRC